MKACFITALVISLLATGLSLPGNELQMSAAKQAFLGERLLDILQERLAEVQVNVCVCVCVDGCMCMHVHACVCGNMWVCVSGCMHMCACACVCGIHIN